MVHHHAHHLEHCTLYVMSSIIGATRCPSALDEANPSDAAEPEQIGISIQSSAK